ncbi:hypothetical protein N7537_009577 [Penicillium hordei]|uniref:Uncharacterized protein n=1 Tax=Penicillium hordei TaxID=40994 RepID=A0AAD6DT46_9EURO|nr:uncharacterized protein N7537_009577 [Penicillium hordei]KAJ5592673.1 hypothetical protein N7537_009577 [Penicillium hordei]
MEPLCILGYAPVSTKKRGFSQQGLNLASFWAVLRLISRRMEALNEDFIPWVSEEEQDRKTFEGCGEVLTHDMNTYSILK